MELFQWAKNPWGQDVLIRISWDLLYVSAIAAGLFIIGHFFMRKKGSSGDVKISDELAASIPEKVTRHSFAARAFHWIMAVSVLVLLFTGFLPVVGVQFGWVTIHWVAGLALIVSVLYHIFHASFFLRLRDIWISRADFREWIQEVRYAAGKTTQKPPKPGKYPVDHRLFHHGIVITTFGVMITGVLMMFRVATPFWARNPYFLGDSTWGWVYVIHGLCSVGLVGMTMAHIYFAVLPEKRWITWSMILGWVTRKDFVANHDPERWVVGKGE